VTASAELPLELRRHAATSPSRPAVVRGGETLSYGELDALADRLANVFRSLGFVRGDHVASLLGNRPFALALAWGAYRSGLYLTPLPTTLAAPELAYLVENSDALAVIVDAQLADPAQTPVGGRGVHLLCHGGPVPGFRAIESLLETVASGPLGDEAPGALMVYTSGTTGAPKGVIRPLPAADFRGTPAFAADLHKLFGLAGSDVRYLSTAPLYHAAPLRFALAVTAGGGTVHVMEHFDAERALQTIEDQAITHSQWVPTMFQRLLALPAERRRAFNAPAHRLAVHGAAPCPARVKEAMIDWWGPILLEYYSGSEGIGLTLIDSAEALRKPGSVGRARKGEVHILDQDGNELPVGERGVVYFSGVAPFSYYKSPDKTAAKTSPQGWQTFGDMGHVDPDGYLFLTDRLDDMIISGGVNVYPQEIERAIQEVRGVWECAVVGIPDDRFGERPVAFIVPARDCDDAPEGLIGRVREHLHGRLGKLKRPDAIQLIDGLPRTATGKVLRRALRTLVQEQRGNNE
jgi:fatty-acyl-CoA synthase